MGETTVVIGVKEGETSKELGSQEGEPVFADVCLCRTRNNKEGPVFAICVSIPMSPNTAFAERVPQLLFIVIHFNDKYVVYKSAFKLFGNRARHLCAGNGVHPG